MSERPDVDRARFQEALEAGNWEFVFRPLVAMRTAGFMAEAGLPADMSASPSALQQTARAFLADEYPIERAPIGSDGQHRPNSADSTHLQLLLAHAFRDLERDYSSASADRFREWALRHGVDRAQRLRWNGWSCLFVRLAARQNERDSSTDRIPPTVNNVVTTRFGRDAFTALNRRIQDARLDPLSTEEVELLAYDPATLSAGGVMPADDLDLMAVLVTDERAYTTWRELGQTMSDADMIRLVTWAGQDASRCGLKPEDIEFRRDRS